MATSIAPAHPPGTVRPAPAIHAASLVKTYGKGEKSVRALAGVGFDVAPGTVFALLGPNGAGKSTTIKILTTLARADAGTARVAGYDVAAEPDRVRRSIGFVSQKPGFDPVATGTENLVRTGRVYGMSRRDARARSAELLERFGLAAAADRVTSAWSGGMQRKLDVAMGLIHHPRVVFLDEPTTGLDPEARADSWAEIARLTADGLTVLLTTHYLEEADALADRLAIVDRGGIVTEGDPEELKSELRGDAVVVELADEAQVAAAQRVLTGTRDVGEVTIDGASVHARVDAGAAALPGILSALEGEQITLASVTVARPSLDDVYLRHAGRAFHATGDEQPGASGQQEVA